MKVNNDKGIEKKANELRAELKAYEREKQAKWYCIDTCYFIELEEGKENVEIVELSTNEPYSHLYTMKVLKQLLLGYYGIGIIYLDEDETEEEKLEEWLDDCGAYVQDYYAISKYPVSFYKKNGVEAFFQEQDEPWTK